MGKVRKGVDVSDITYTLDWAVGDDAPQIVAARSRKTGPAMHDPVFCGDDSDTDWALYLGTLTAAKMSKAAFVSAFTSAWGSTAAAAIGAWTTAEQDKLVAVAAKLAVRLGV